MLDPVPAPGKTLRGYARPIPSRWSLADVILWTIRKDVAFKLRSTAEHRFTPFDDEDGLVCFEVFTHPHELQDLWSQW
jgi:hypothetical protein